MRRWAPAIPLILLMLNGLGCSGAPSADDTSAPSSTGVVGSGPSQTLADLTNAERTRAGLTPLVPSSPLTTAAQLQADQLASLQVLEHDVPAGRYPTPADRLAAAGYPWQAYGENLASGYSTAADTIAGWLNSSGHRANILNATFSEFGVAYAIDPTGRPYWVQVFARPR
jgi:uncharacterized protein YkwD